MGYREKRNIVFKCENCNSLGKAVWSENDYMYMSRLDAEIDNIEGNFSVDYENNRTPRLKCDDCGSFISDYQW